MLFLSLLHPIPSQVQREVNEVQTSLSHVINKLCALENVDSIHFLDAPRYLFVAKQVAVQYPNLLESVIINSYQAYLPPTVLADKWRFGSHASHSPSAIMRFATAGRFAVFSVLLTTLQAFGASPFALQRMLIRVVQPWVLTGM